MTLLGLMEVTADWHELCGIAAHYAAIQRTIGPTVQHDRHTTATISRNCMA